MSVVWDANPFAFGAIQARVNGNRIGGISNTDKVRGFFLRDTVYVGDSEQDAMKAVEDQWNAVPVVIQAAIVKKQEG